MILKIPSAVKEMGFFLLDQHLQFDATPVATLRSDVVFHGNRSLRRLAGLLSSPDFS